MAEEQERWQMKINSLKQGIAHIYDTKEFSDVQFHVQGQYIFKAHRLFLAARSAEFARMLLGPNSIDEIIIDDENVTKTGFEILLHFIYKDLIGTSDKQAIIEAYLAASHFRQKGLLLRCEEEIRSWLITTDEVCKLLDAGWNVPFLKEKCFHFIKNNGDEVISNPSFSNISFRCLCLILENDALKNVPALKCIENVAKWAANQQNQSEDQNKPLNYICVRNCLLQHEPPLMRCLKFEQLNLEQLSDVIVLYEGLLTPAEITSFMMFNRSKNASILPKWCLP